MHNHCTNFLVAAESRAMKGAYAMKKITFILIFTLTCAVFLSNVHAQQIPGTIRQLPAYTRAFVHIQKLPDTPLVKTGLAMVHPELPGILDSLQGEMVLALLEFGKGDHVIFLYGARIRGGAEQNWETLRKSLSSLLQGERISLPPQPEGAVVENKRNTVGFLGHSGEWVWFSNSESAVLSAAQGNPESHKGMYSNRLFKQTFAGCGTGSVLTAYIDAETIMPFLLDESIHSMQKWFKRVYTACNLCSVRACTVTAGLSGIQGAMLMKDTRIGLPRLVFGQNTVSDLIKHIPADTGGLLRVSVDSADDILYLYKRIAASVDPDILTETETELTEFRQKHGVDIERDILRSLCGEIGIGITPGPDPRHPGIFVISGLSQREAFETAVRKLFKLWEVPPRREKHTSGTLYVKGKTALYVGHGFCAAGPVALIRKIVETRPENSLNSVNMDFLKQPACTFISFNPGSCIGAIQKEMKDEPGDPDNAFLKFLLPIAQGILPRAALVFTRTGDMVTFRTEIEGGEAALRAIAGFLTQSPVIKALKDKAKNE